MGSCWLQTAKPVHLLIISFCFVSLAGHLLSFISVGKVLGKAVWIVGLGGRKFRWVVEEDLHRNFRVNLTSFLPFSQRPSFLIDSCSLFGPGLEDLSSTPPLPSLLPLLWGTHVIYRKIPKISPGAYIFQRPFLRGLFLEGLIYGGKFAFQNRLG